MEKLQTLPHNPQYSKKTTSLIREYNEEYEKLIEAKTTLNDAKLALNSEDGLNVKPEKLGQYVVIERTYPPKIYDLEYEARKKLEKALAAIEPEESKAIRKIMARKREMRDEIQKKIEELGLEAGYAKRIVHTYRFKPIIKLEIEMLNAGKNTSRWRHINRRIMRNFQD